MTRTRALGMSLMLWLLRVPSAAHAQTDDPKVSARAHFDQGVSAFNDQRFAEAKKEFEAAYQSLPTFEVLYNIGQVNVVLGRSVEAIDAFEKYLAEGGGAIAAERRQGVEWELEQQRDHVGTLAVHTSPEGAEVRVDGKSVGRSPVLSPIRVAAGAHTVEAQSAGYTGQFREVEVAGRGRTEVSFELVPTPPPPPSSPPSPPRSLADKPPIATEGLRRQTGHGRQTAGYVLAGVGSVAIGFGTLLVLSGFTSANDAKSRMASATTGKDWDTAYADYGPGKSRYDVGWGVAGAGAAALVGGVLVAVTGPRHTPNARLEVTPWTSAGEGGLAARGVW